MVYINAREVAAEVLLEIEKNEAFSNIALKKALKANGAMDEKNRAFVTEMVNGTLRNIIYIDYVINCFSSVKTNKLKPWLLAVIRISVYQIIFLKVPDSAAINEAVNLIKKRGLFKLSGFVNAVLRKTASEYEKISLPDKNTAFAEYLSIKYSHPIWIVKMWINYYGEEFTEKLCIADTMQAKVTATINLIKTDRESLIKILQKEGMEVERAKFSPISIYISKTGSLAKSKAFADGLFYIQDESSAIAAQVLDPKSGEKILDCCAAPGGKTLAMAEIMHNKGSIYSCDVFEHKLELINENAKRLGITIVKTQLKDTTVHYDKWNEGFDKIYIDVPCSGLGLMRKKADIRLKKTGADIDELIVLQRKILGNCHSYVKKGGYMLYSTCTLSRKENTGNMKWFCENFDYEMTDITEVLPKGLECETAKNGYIELYPNVQGTDGFFICRLRRKGIQ